MEEQERRLAWMAVLWVLNGYDERIGNPWPEEFVGRSGEEILEATLRTEEELRAPLDATARSMARAQHVPGMTPLERWHFAHRIVFAKTECGRRYGAGERLPEDEDQALEQMLVDDWLANIPAWRAQMRQAAASL